MSVLAKLCKLSVTIALLIGAAGCSTTADQSAPSSPSSPPSHVELPFTGLKNPTGVAVDTTGNVYVTDFFNNRVLKRLPGSNAPVELPFTGLHLPIGVGVDTARNALHHRRQPQSGSQTTGGVSPHRRVSALPR
jgi:DNA-binding beta-propeller fold protein YncE